MLTTKHHIFQTLKIIVLALILTTGLSIALAWTGPTAAPPGNNTDEPLNTSNNWQTKYGYLSLPKLYDSNEGQTGYYIDPGANSWLYRLYSYDIRSSIFYDQDNTSYYVDPASTSKLNRVDASIVYDRDNTAYYSNPASTSYYNDMRANIYYDKGNTGYYVDPASTSKFNTINLGGESKSSWPSGDTIPSGAIMAFDLVGCPSGWSELTSARGRVIVGLNPGDGSFNSRGETGGAKTHTLTIAEMPSHSHSMTAYEYTSSPSLYSHVAGGIDSGVTSSPFTNSVGGNQPHNNLQPYISFIYCKKN